MGKLWWSILVVVCAAMGILSSVGGVEGVLSLGVIAFGIGFLAFWMTRPVEWMVVSMCVYAVVQNNLEMAEIGVMGHPVNLSQLFWGVVISLVVIRLIVKGGGIGKYWLVSSLFVLSCIVALLMGRATSSGTAAVFRTAGVLVIFLFVMSAARERKHYYFILGATIFASLCSSGALLWDFFVQERSAVAEIVVGARRAGGVFGRPNISADVAMLAIPALVIVARRLNGQERWTVRVLPYLGGVLCMAGLFTSFTRANLLAVGLVIGLVVYDSLRDSRVQVRVAGVLSVVVVLVGVWVGVRLVGREAVEARIADVPLVGGESLADPGAGSGRVMIWRAILSDLVGRSSVRSVMIGHGLWSTLDATRRRISSGWAAHNSYLELLYNQGVVGVALYLAFYVLMIKDLTALQRREWWLQGDSRVWLFMIVAFLLSTEMFTTACYSLASRLYLYTPVAALLGLGGRE